MKKLGKFIGRVCLGAAAASVVPYYIRMDRETGGFQVGSLLWAVKKTPGKERDKYTIELLPLFGAKEEAAEEEAAEEEAAEEEAAEE